MTVSILIGDALERLRELPDESVHCCITSPPYWNLRAYCGDPGMIGLEPTLDEHIANLVSVFREVRRVLRGDGTLWLNYGDAYAASGSHGGGWANGKQTTNKGSIRGGKTPGDWKPKDLMMLPARVAMALQADGWYLRSEIVWHKPNPMPESVQDRPTSAHEKVFLLSKSPRYFWDAEAVRTQAKPASIERDKYPYEHSRTAWGSSNGHHGNNPNEKRRPDKQRGHSRRHDGLTDTWDAMPKDAQQAAGASLRNVWSIATHPYPGSHFATFPPALVEPCIKAGTSARGVCGECGAPWAREVERKFQPDGAPDRYNMDESNGWSGFPRGVNNVTTTGWHPTCDCTTRKPVRPAVCLDPFAGAGTVGLVAQRLGRDAVLIEINSEYAAMARKRIDADQPGLVGLAV